MTDPVASAARSSTRTRSRLLLLLIAAMFFGSFGVAATLFFGGWQPERTRNHGELLDPYLDLRDLPLAQADGRAYAWQPERRRWRIVAIVPADCAASCAALLDRLYRVWYSEGRHAERLDVLWFGTLPTGAPSFSGLRPMAPSPALAERLPDRATVEALPVYLVDPNGYVVLRYPAGFDPSGLRKDLGRLIK